MMHISNMHIDSSATDRELERAQRRFLDRACPGWRAWRATWRGGGAQVLELGAGPVVLCVHGGLGDAFQWAPVMAALAPRHRVLAVDRPGHGLSDPYDYRHVDLPAHARDFLTAVLDAAEAPVATVVGASLGGLLSFHLALARPDRVERLVLPGATAGTTRSLPWMLRLGQLPGLRRLVRRQMREPTRASARSFWRQLLVAHPERLGDDFLDACAASQRRNAESWFTLIDALIGVGGLRRDLLLDALWPKLRVPTTFVWGERDAWAPTGVGAGLAARNPRVTLVRVPDAGHAVWLDAPGPTLAAIEAP
jgi:pimeloyl-ACP methyl ester carboxylesterase